MGKKVDLNAPRKDALGNKPTRSSHSFSYANKSSKENINNNHENNGSSVDDYSEEKSKVKGEIKFPIKVKIVLTLIIVFAVASIFLILFVTFLPWLTFDGDFDTIALGKTCHTVTVINTADNLYDGEVDFEDYIAGVVSAEISPSSNTELLKAAAIAARTYFLGHVDSDCTVEGNESFQAYIDVEDGSNSNAIKKAVEETRGLVMVHDNDLINAEYASACVVNADDDFYYIRYGTESLGEPNYQRIPTEWDIKESDYPGYLRNWYSMVDQSDTNYDNKECPHNHDYGMSQIGALYLITENSLNYQEVLEYYYGDIELKSVYGDVPSNMVDGFINPLGSFVCTSGFGCRLHPIYNRYQIHSGIDLGASSGTPVFATKSGIVTRVLSSVPGYSTTYTCGNYITIDHQDGTSTQYCHLLYGGISDDIYVGAVVTQGQMIAKVGSTGASTGPHLHYMVYIDGRLSNPYYVLDLSGQANTSACNDKADTPISYCGY